MRHLLAHKVGTGKSITALALCEKFGGTTLVICTKTLKMEGKWESEWAKFENPVPIMVVTKEEFRRDYKKIPAHDNLIVDEAHLGFGNMKALLHKALAAWIKVREPKRVYLLTGTPYTSTPISVFALARLLGHKWNWLKWRDQFFQERYLGNRVVWEPKTGIEEQLADKVREIGSIVRMEDCVDVPEQTFITERFPMTPAQKKALKEMSKTELDPLQKFQKAHQIAQGILIGNEFEAAQDFDALKNQRVVELAQENEKMVVFARFNAHLALLGRMLDAAHIPNVTITGATKDRGDVLKDARTAPRMVVLIQAEIAEGYQLPEFDVMVFASLSYSFVKYEQQQGRIQRIDAISHNTYIHLLTAGGIDDAVRASVDKKQDFSEAIYTHQHFAPTDVSGGDVLE